MRKGYLGPKRFCSCGSLKDSKAKNCLTCFIEKRRRKFPCIICGNNVSKSHVKTCSRECFIKRRSEQSWLDKNPNWKGGLKTENQRQRNHADYIQWRKDVYARDNYTCQDCGKTKCYLHAHHIKPFSSHPELRTNVDNGKTLCVECHSKYHNNLNVKKYKPQSA